MEDTWGAYRYPKTTLSDEEQEGDSESHKAAWASLSWSPYAVPTGLQPDPPPSSGSPWAEPSAAPRSPGGSKKLVMKRKVLRRRPDGGVEVSDESVCSTLENSAAIWSLRQKMLQLGVDPDDSLSEGEMSMSSSLLQEGSYQQQGAACEPPFLLRVLQRSTSPTSPYVATARQPKSFIPPRLETLGRSSSKIDRVSRYLEYKREWQRLSIPGENHHWDLRRDIQEQMRDQANVLSKPQCARVPNTYTAPTDKKRHALRWQVRYHLAKGLVPRRNTAL